MRKKALILICLFSLCFSFITFSQTELNDRLKIFVDCRYCDMTFIRSEINLVDFLLDNKAADVHVLITNQRTGGGGDQFQLIFFGQNKFKNLIPHKGKKQNPLLQKIHGIIGFTK